MTKKERKDAILQKQMEMAMNGSVEMLKWLGIQYCGQSNQPSRDDGELPTGFDIQLITPEGMGDYKIKK